MLSLMRASLVTPLNTIAFGLYLRMWHRAGLPDLDGPIEALEGLAVSANSGTVYR
ncbi:hypothetical protein ACFO5K_10605 [Nocardia halotolerans]|uniref:Uncharacterized protein n=1 Tax=Nocardia halotolerans TaxID=1755878 RepID=A0ABV8VEU2_9NOCA